MRSLKVWVFGSFVLAFLSGLAVVGTSPSFGQPREERREERSYWRNHDGRWSHWDARDRRWYYTDGQHWYYHNGNAWQPYRFDRTFGRENFERGNYVLPGEGVVVPRHGVYVPR